MADSEPKGDPDLAARVVQALEHSGRSQRQIALEMGLQPQSVTKWKRHGYMDKRNIPAFCRACGVSIEWFLTGEGPIDAPNPLRDATDQEIIQAVSDNLTPAQQAELMKELIEQLAPVPERSR